MEGVIEPPKASPSRTETDQRCRMQRYWETEYEGTGIETVAMNEDKEIGKRVHLGVELFHGGVHMDEVVKRLREEALTEPWQSWIEAILWAWGTRVWPRFEEHYRVAGVERKLKIERYGVLWRVIPDLVLEDQRDGTMLVVDFKSCKRWDAKRWLRRMQFHVGAAAVEEISGRTVSGTVVVGLPKPFFRGDKAYHSLVYGYKREGEPGITRAAYSYEYKRGFERFMVNGGFEGGVEAWVKRAPDLIISDAMPMTHPIPLDRGMLDTFFRERAIREREIQFYSKVIRELGHTNPTAQAEFDVAFPHNTSNCEGDGWKCDMFDACWQPVVWKDPVGSGIYKLRGSKV